MEKNLTYIALFAALIAVLGLVPGVTLFSGIPINAQSLGIMLCGTILGGKRGALAVLLFLALVALGLPLLYGGRGGLGVFTTPWAGFLFGFPVSAYVTGRIMEKWDGNSFLLGAVIASVVGALVLYLIAYIAYAYISASSYAEAFGIIVVPFIPGDLLKAVVAGFITHAVYKARPDALLSRS